MSLSFFNPGSQPQPITRCAVAPSPGQVIASPALDTYYVFGEKIGEGSFSVVYSCRDKWGNELAAKVLKPTNTYESVRAAATSEFHKLAFLRHPRLITVFDSFEFRDTFFIITERCYCSLQELLPRIRRNGLAWVMPVAQCLLEGLDFLHSKQYSHQDIHLGNVHASNPDFDAQPAAHNTVQFKIGDLGVAKLFSELGQNNTRAPWMKPPEVCDPSEYGPIDHRTDIYHAALLFLQVAHSRELRFSTNDILVGRPRAMALRLPHPYDWSLERALRRHANQRTPTAGDLWNDLLWNSTAT
jgi:serine/threonine protein kinase